MNLKNSPITKPKITAYMPMVFLKIKIKIKLITALNIGDRAGKINFLWEFKSPDNMLVQEEKTIKNMLIRKNLKIKSMLLLLKFVMSESRGLKKSDKIPEIKTRAIVEITKMLPINLPTSSLLNLASAIKGTTVLSSVIAKTPDIKIKIP